MVNAIILLGGSGSRMSFSLPKQFVLVNDKPLFVYTVEAFSCVDNVVLVTKEEYKELTEQYVRKYHLTKVKDVVIGGKTRQESVRNGLHSSILKDEDIVLIHDAARCNIKEEVIKENIKAIKEEGTAAILTAAKETNTVYHLNGNNVSLLDRDTLICAQTPQTFYVANIRKLHEKYRDRIVTDDISLALLDNQKVAVVYTDNSNFKITTDFDLKLFQEIKK